MGKFTKNQETFFNAKYGAGSVVSNREEYDSQITLDKYETQVLHAILPHSAIPIGSVKKNPIAAKFNFLNLNTSATVALNLNRPKPAKNETRLYLSEVSGYKPTAGEYWFIFVDAHTNDLVIGHVDEVTWISSGGKRDLSKTSRITPKPVKIARPAKDDEDHIYQDDLSNLNPASSSVVIYTREKRSRSIAEKSLKAAGYQCEISSSHKTFNSPNGKPYVEAHHLVPLSQTNNLGINLDVMENIVSMCPNCHRAIHYAEKSERFVYIKTLFALRNKSLKSRGISLTMFNLAKMYNCV